MVDANQSAAGSSDPREHGWTSMAELAYRSSKYPLDRSQWLATARRVIRDEAAALLTAADQLDASFLSAVDRILSIRGSVIVSGMGKAGLIGQKLAATFASTGTPSHFLHPAEAVHGDLGRVRKGDLVLILSQSGETAEVTKILPMLKEQSSGLIAITSNPNSKLARQATDCILIPKLPEACAHGLAPSTSTTSMLAIGDALALLVSQLRGFSSNDFAKYHPGGSLGQRLSRVEEIMRPLDHCRVGPAHLSVREILIAVAKAGRRTGAIMLVDSTGKLSGIFTDSDLAKLMEQRCEKQLDGPIESVMTKRFHAIREGARYEDALSLLASKKFSELPVVDDSDRPIGMIDITDMLGLVQRDSNEGDVQLESDRPATIRLFREEDHEVRRDG